MQPWMTRILRSTVVPPEWFSPPLCLTCDHAKSRYRTSECAGDRRNVRQCYWYPSMIDGKVEFVRFGGASTFELHYYCCIRSALEPHPDKRMRIKMLKAYVISLIIGFWTWSGEKRSRQSPAEFRDEDSAYLFTYGCEKKTRLFTPFFIYFPWMPIY